MFAEGIAVPPIVATFLLWTWMRAMLHRGYWLVASLYLVDDARLSPAQLVLIGSAQAVVSLVAEVPTGVMADTISRKWSLVISQALIGLSMALTGLVTSFPALVATQMLWGIGWTFASGADVAWITDELGRPDLTAAVLTAYARWQEIGAVTGMLLVGLLAWATGRGTSMVIAGVVMALLGLYIVARFTERNFTPTRTQRWRQSMVTLRRAVAVARLDRVIVVMFVATFLVNGASDTFGRLFPRQLIDRGFPQRPDLIVWFTGLGVLTHIVGALALRIVEARIAGVNVARRVYAAACGIGACGVLLLATAPDAITGSAGVLLVAGIGWTVTRAAGAIVVTARSSNEVRATVQSFLGQVEYAGEIYCGLMLAVIAETTSITFALVGACALVACAGMVAQARADHR